MSFDFNNELSIDNSIIDKYTPEDLISVINDAYANQTYGMGTGYDFRYDEKIDGYIIDLRRSSYNVDPDMFFHIALHNKLLFLSVFGNRDIKLFFIGVSAINPSCLSFTDHINWTYSVDKIMDDLIFLTTLASVMCSRVEYPGQVVFKYPIELFLWHNMKGASVLSKFIGWCLENPKITKQVPISLQFFNRVIRSYREFTVQHEYPFDKKTQPVSLHYLMHELKVYFNN